jgi:hypothetical protein
MNRREKIIQKYGSWGAYEKSRRDTLRKNKLAKCETEEEKRILKGRWALQEFLSQNSDPSKIGEACSCVDCGKEFKAKKNQQALCNSCLNKRSRIISFGSLEKAYSSADLKAKKTRKEIYGDENFNNRDKCKETFQEKYGVDHVAQTKEHIKKIQDTKEAKYGDRGFVNSEKRKQTNLAKYGVESTASIPEVREKQYETKMKKYGNRFGDKKKADDTIRRNHDGLGYASEEIKRKAFETTVQKHGGIGTGSVSIQQRIKETTKENYGVDNYWKSEEHKKNLKENNPMFDSEVKDKCHQTLLEKYGTFFVKRVLYFEDLVFDSSWELYYYLYLRDHKIDFEYKPERILYGNGRHYYPDFKVNGIIEDVKGDFLLKEDGTLKDEEKQELFDRVGVKIIDREKLQKVFKYVDNKYGKDYVFSFRRTA